MLKKHLSTLAVALAIILSAVGAGFFIHNDDVALVQDGQAIACSSGDQSGGGC